MTIATVDFVSYRRSVAEVLSKAGFARRLGGHSRVLLKPNLVTASPFPVTTRPEFCEAVIGCIRSCSSADIVVAEGCGDANCDTSDIYRILGYDRMAAKTGVRLIDLNTAGTVAMTGSDCRRFREMHLPDVLFTHFVISLPVLKAHSLAMMTGAMKNMMGCVPPAFCAGPPGRWKKAAFHDDIHQSIRDLAGYRSPDFAVMDASVGLAEYHLGGAVCRPPIGKLIAGDDARAVDRHAATLLGLDWRRIPYMKNVD